MKDKAYKIRHIPTGLYYIPIRGRFTGQKSNLSRNGKVYIASKPVFAHINHSISISDSLLKKFPNITHCKDYSGRQNVIPWNENEWEIITYDLIENTKNG